METTHVRTAAAAPAVPGGTKDGLGAADHDVAYRFGLRPSSRWTYPFTGWQLSRLLILRGRMQDGEFADDSGPDVPTAV